MFSLLVSGLAVGTARSQDEEPSDKFTINSKVADAKECVCRACNINFYKEFGVPLEYLGSIGQDIHDARLKPDPVSLALCARSLQVAEEVSGKKASVTSDEVMKDAIHLGKLRGVSSELSALVAIASDAATKKELAKEAEAAKVREEEAKQDLADGVQTKELIGTLVVCNHSSECVRIYVSGHYAGVVHEGQCRHFHVHDHNYHTELTAYCVEGGELVSTSCAEGHNHHFTWVIR
jgi:hypothetical protein